MVATWKFASAKKGTTAFIIEGKTSDVKNMVKEFKQCNNKLQVLEERSLTISKQYTVFLVFKGRANVPLAYQKNDSEDSYNSSSEEF